jgi:SAM-dependent methyltransferase
VSSVNYSEGLLRSEHDKREPIRHALQLLMTRYNVRGQDILELGSGLGYNLEVFARDNRVVGIEGLCSAADATTARGIPTIAADLSAAVPLDSERFDVVLCLDVLEHLLDPANCLNEAHRILRRSGLLVVNVPNHFSLSGRLNIARGSGIDSVRFFPQHSDWENPHVRFFRHSSITSLINHCSFQLEADWSERFPSIPILNKLRLLKNSPLAHALARYAPELFAGGFFIIARKQSTIARS